MIKKIKTALPAVFMSLSLISCQMGLANSNNAGNFNAREANVNGLAEESFDFEGIAISYDTDNVYVRISESSGDAAIYNIYIDADGDSTTGQNPGWWTGNGADFLIQKVNDCAPILHKYDELNAVWVEVEKPFECDFNSEKQERNLKIAFDTLGINSSDINKVGVAYMSMSGWNMPDDIITVTPALWGTFAKYSPKSVDLSDKNMQLTYDYKYMNLSIDELVLDAEIYNLYIDADGDSKTGQNPGWWTGNGADFLIQKVNDCAATLYRYDEKQRNWIDTQKPVFCVNDTENNKRNLKMSFEALGINISDINKVGFAYMSMHGWNMPDDMITIVPKQNDSFATKIKSTNNSDENPFPRKRTDIGSGIIIPAYINLNEDIDSEKNSGLWKDFIEEISMMNLSGKDLYVVVNGTNGPSGIIWNQANAIFKKIKNINNNIKIIGYVHTCETPVPEPGKDFLKFCDISVVMGDIKKWVDKSEGLIDGIWIDEFYPWYEIGSDTPTEGPTYPNLIDNAPKDKSKFEKDHAWIWYDVDYFGGYYYQLCKAIYDYNKDLITIGNAGGGFRSTQTMYGELVDILVSFEQTYEYANQACTYEGNEDKTWMEYCVSLASKADKKLALIHGAYSFSEVDSIEFRKNFLNEMKETYSLETLREEYKKDINMTGFINMLFTGNQINENILNVSSSEFRKVATCVFAEDFLRAVRSQSEALGKTAECFTNVLEAAIETAAKNGFSHVYVTDREYGYNGNGNIWGGLPSYLKSEVESEKLNSLKVN